MQAGIHKPSIDWGVVGLGRCGTNIAEELYYRGYKTTAFNSSLTDVRGSRMPAENICNISIQSRDGAGQDMFLGEYYLQNNSQKVIEFADKKVGDSENILLTAGLGGGTGSAVYMLASILKSMNKPITALVTLPCGGEGSIAKVNAVRALKRLIDSPVDSIMVLNNHKLLSLKRNLNEFYLAGNRQAAGLFDSINRISHNTNYRPVLGFDSEDLRRFFLQRGFMAMMEAELTEKDIQGEGLVSRFIETMENGGLYSGGMDLHKSTLLGLIFTVQDSLIKNCPADCLNNLQEYIKNRTASCGIMLGLFSTKESVSPKMTIIIAGAPIPGEVENLIAQAKSEGKMLSFKTISSSKKLDYEEISGIVEMVKSRRG